MVCSVSRVAIPVTTAVQDEVCPFEVPVVVPWPGVVSTATVVPGARSGGNCPGFNPTAAIALPCKGICGDPSTERVTSEPAGRLNATGCPTTVDADDAGGTPLDVYRNAKAFERAGAGAVMYEDRIRTDRLKGVTRVSPVNEMVDRIHAGNKKSALAR